MDAEDAFLGYPSFSLFGDKSSYSFFSDKFQVFDLAHPVCCPVAFVQMPETVAGEFRAVAVKLTGAFCADAQAAFHAGFWFALLNVFTAWTEILFA